MDWLDSLELRILRLQDLDLPRGFALDYSVDSLRHLEAVVLDRLINPALDDQFLLSAAAYLGESLMRVGGGAWGWADDQPVARPDPSLGLPPVMPVRELTDALRVGDGRRLAMLHASWAKAAEGRSPTKTPTSLDRISRRNRIPAWLAMQEAMFADWVARYAPDRTWDFSAESLPALEEVVRRAAPDEASFNDPSHRDLRNVAAWYLGETMRRNLGGYWANDRDYEFVRQVGPHREKCVPVLTLKRSLKNPGLLREFYYDLAA